MADLFSLLAGFAESDGDLVQAMVDGADYGVEKNLDPAYAALQLEMLSEAARNDKVATLLRHADDSMRAQLKLLLAGPQGSLRTLPDAEVDARIELLASVYNGLLVRAVLHPQLDRQQLLQALRPWLRQLLAA